MNTSVNIDDLRKILKYIAKGYKVPKIVYDTVREVAAREIEERGKVVLIKRDPDVARDRIQSAYAKIVDEETISMHPCRVGGFGADFDGDSVYGEITVYTYFRGNYFPKVIHIKDLSKEFDVILESDNTNEVGKRIRNYTVDDAIYADAIDINTGKVHKRRITHWSEHSNLKMVKVHSNRFNIDFYSSDDHSMVAYDGKNRRFLRISPKELNEDKSRYYLVRNKETN